jgi:hypothetical protein
MSITKRLLSAALLGSVALFLAFLPSSGRSASPQQVAATTSATPPQYSSGPVTDYNAALSNSSDVLRFRRGERYNSPNSPLSDLGEQSDPVLVVEDMGSYYRDPMPFDQSDAVIVGRVASGQAYLSNDKRDLYSEFKVTVQEALKVPAARYVQAGNSVEVERQGGAIRLPSGKVLIRGSSDFSMPLVGKRYLLFLRYNQSTEDFHIVTGYQLEGQHTYGLDELAYAHSDRRHETLVRPLHEKGDNEEQLLGRARAAKPTNKGGK